MRTLVMPKHIFEEIACIVSQSFDGLETGVTLFGTTAKEHHAVLAVAGPGRNATHESARYSGDEAHANAIFRALRSALPGIRWLGEVHVHPKGMTWLSRGDLETVHDILAGTDDTLHPEEFIGGVMQRRTGTVDIYAWHFNKECLQGTAMEIRIVESGASEIQDARRNALEEGECYDRSDLREKSRRSETPVGETRRHRWLRKWRQRVRVYGGKIWRRAIHANRSGAARS